MSKYAFLLNTGPDEAATLTNVLEYARKLDAADHDVVVFFDGEATQWIPELEGNNEAMPSEAYAAVRERGLISGACGFCASVFEVDRSIENVGIGLDGEMGNHGPDIDQLASEGYELLPIS